MGIEQHILAFAGLGRGVKHLPFADELHGAMQACGGQTLMHQLLCLIHARNGGALGPAGHQGGDEFNAIQHNNSS